MIAADRQRFADLLEELAIAYDVELRVGRAPIYFRDLERWSFDIVAEAARDLRSTCPKFPPISVWNDACKAAASRRARAKQEPSSTAEPTSPANWSAVANVIAIYALLAGERFVDAADRDRALAFIRGELVVLHEEYSRPADVPRERYAAERARIVRALRDARAGERERTT